MVDQDFPGMSNQSRSGRSNGDRSKWTQGERVQLKISTLTSQGDGLGHIDNRVVFVPNTVPGDEIETRLVRVKRTQAHGVLEHLLQPSSRRVRPACIVADKCGGCQWQPVDYGLQLEIKQQSVLDALERVGQLAVPQPIPILAAPSQLRYRNKVTYPVQQRQDGTIKIGYYQRGSHHLINLNQCPVQDERLDPVLQGIKQDLETAGWSAYDETHHQGLIRHLSLRIGRRTGELLLTLVATEAQLPQLTSWAKYWHDRYGTDDAPVVGVCLNINPAKTNAIFGPDTQTIVGRPYLQETFAGLKLQIDSTSFFQVYTEQAESFFEWILQQLNLTGSEIVIDAYCGLGTLALMMAPRVQWVFGIESLLAAVEQADANAYLNQIRNIEFRCGVVEAVLPTLPSSDLVILDPPRKGCDSGVLQALLYRLPAAIVYISCHPATLARDLKQLLKSGHYTLTQWRTADFFPQTSHVETVAFLHRLTPKE